MATSSLHEAVSATDTFSTTVRLRLYVEGVAYEVADVGPVDLTLRTPPVLLQGSDHAVLEISIDGRAERQHVRVSASNDQHIVCYSLLQ